MPMPKSVKVGATTFQVRGMSREAELLGADWGGADFGTNTITVSAAVSDPRRKETLLHEILHCIYYEWNIQLEDDEERTVSAFAFGLSAVMKDNPLAFKWLMEKKEK